MSDNDYVSDHELRKNASGCSDPTAYKAIKNLERREKLEDRCVCCGRIIPEGFQVCPMCQPNDTREDDKFHKLLHTIFYLCELAGFKIEGRIVLVDKESGRTWR